MNLWQHYLCPSTVLEALQALRDAPAPATPIAGGTDLLLDLGQGRHSPSTTLVDLTTVEEMTALEIRDGALFIGAAVPLSRVASDRHVREHATALSEACELVGGPQVRNVATLGGNVAHALPAADGTIALVAMDALAEIASLSGTRWLPVIDLFVGPGRSVLRTGEELIVGFSVRMLRPGQGSAFRRVMRPQGVALPIINVGIWMERADDGVSSARLAIGPAGPTPRRSAAGEGALTGKPYSDRLCQVAVEAILKETAFRTNPRRASAAYRRQLLLPVLAEAVDGAWSRTLQ